MSQPWYNFQSNYPNLMASESNGWLPEQDQSILNIDSTQFLNPDYGQSEEIAQYPSLFGEQNLGMMYQQQQLVEDSQPAASQPERQSTNESKSSNSHQDSQAGPSNAPGTDASERNLKRGMACSFCRRRKLKCSGERPKCSSCIKYTKDCEYAPPAKLAKFKALETRISELSDYIRQNTIEKTADEGTSSSTPSIVPPPAPTPITATERHHIDPPMFPELSAATASLACVPETDHVPPSMLRYAPARPAATIPTFPTAAVPGAGPYPASTMFNPDAIFGYPPDTGPNPTINPVLAPAPTPAFTMQLQEGFSPFSSQVDYLRRSREQHAQQPQNFLSNGTATSLPSFAQPAQRANFDQAQNGGIFDMGLRSEPQSNVPRPLNPTFSTPASTSSPLSRYGSSNPGGTPDDADRERVNAQQKAAAMKFLRSARQSSLAKSTPSPKSGSPDAMIGLPLTSTVDEKMSNAYGRPLPNHGLMNGIADAPVDPAANAHKLNVATIDPVDGITESLGEFLFSPKVAVDGASSGTPSPRQDASAATKKKRRGTDTDRFCGSHAGSMIKVESDGLTDSAREALLDCFLAHSRLFFEMSIPRFRYRMTFTDRRRPAPALLYAMYLWATRMSNSPRISPMEAHFFSAAMKALDVSSSSADRLIDCMRAAMLLSCYSYTSGRYHEGWVLSGMAVRMILSTGLHQIRSCVFTPEPPHDPLLRGKGYLLGPPEDATDLAERISTFWGIIAMERGCAIATGFPSGISDADILTPFPRAFGDIASRAVTQQDDLTIRDLYRHSYFPSDDDQPFGKWMKAVVILERASKLAFLDPDEDSEYARAWSTYFLQSPNNPRLANPPAWLDQPKYRRPRDYSETKLALDQLRESMGVEGVFPVDIRRNAEIDGAEEPVITAHAIKLHHKFAATYMFMHDINAHGVENKEALVGARRSVSLMRNLPPLKYADVDTFLITVWSIIAKCLIKELRRVYSAGDIQAVTSVSEEVDLYIDSMNNVGFVMQLARSQAAALTELKKYALSQQMDKQNVEEERTRRAPGGSTSL